MDHPLDTGTPKGIKEKEDYLKEIEEFQKRMRPEHRGEGGIKTAATAYGDMFRGRYQYLNEFMDDMQSEPEELKNLTKSQELRLQRMMKAQASSTQYIVAAFVAATALCAGVSYGTWLYTKSTMDVKDGKEYAEKMRDSGVGATEALTEGVIGRGMRDFKTRFVSFLEGSVSFQNFARQLRGNMVGMQDEIKRRPSTGIEARLFSRSLSSGAPTPETFAQVRRRITGAAPDVPIEAFAPPSAPAGPPSPAGSPDRMAKS